MKHRTIIALLLAAACLFGVTLQAAAHGQTEVGDYELEIGFHNEPAYLNQPNGLDLFVTNSTTGDPVNGLEETLQAEIIFGSSSQILPLEAQDEAEGAYTAYIVPTEVGDYTWHIFGTIEGTPVDVSMTSSPDTFGSVEATSDYAFPAAAAAASTSSAASTSQTALIVSVIAALLGLAGLVAGLMGWRAARR